ncbi:hypothetical protein KI387_022481, partial [Taxus chinensis]
VVSGDLVCDVPPGAVAATHRRQEATVTALLCSPPAVGPSEAGSSAGGKDKAKRPRLFNIIGLDYTDHFLLFVASGEKDLCIQRSILHATGQEGGVRHLVWDTLYCFGIHKLNPVGFNGSLLQWFQSIVRALLHLKIHLGERIDCNSPFVLHGNWGSKGTKFDNSWREIRSRSVLLET